MSTVYSDKVGEFLPNDYEGKIDFLPDTEYARMLDAVVITCVDMLPSINGKVLLGKRIHQPQADWWLFGGRLRTGEQLTEAAARLAKTEMGLVCGHERFRYITAFVAAWNQREQEPKNHGAHTASFVFTMELTQAELDVLHLNDEYADHVLVEPQHILDDSSYHPALRHCTKALLKAVPNPSWTSTT